MGIKQVLKDATDIRQRDANVRWVVANQQDLWDNYPNRWIVVDKEAVQIVNTEFFPIFRTMYDRPSLTPSTVFYYSVQFTTPVFLTWLDVSSLLNK